MTASLGGWAVGSIVVVLLVTLPAWLAGDPIGTVRTFAGTLCAAVIVYSAIRLAMLVVAGRAAYMAFVFWTFVYVWFGLSAFLQLSVGDFPRRTNFIGSTYSAGLLWRAEAVVIIGCIGYEVGYRLKPRLRIGALDASTRSLSPRKLVIACWVAIGLAVLYLALVGAALFTSRTDLGRMGFDKQLKTVLFAVGAIAAWCIGPNGSMRWRTNRHARRYLFAATIVLTLLVCNPVTTQRGLAGAVYGSVLLALVDVRSRRAIRVVTITILVGTILVFPALDVFRGASSSRYDKVIQTGDVFQPLRETSGNYAMYTEVADGVDYVDKFGHTDGKHLLATTFVFVPRSIWHGKADNLANSVTRQLGYPAYFNFASPLWMEFYVEGGMPLLFVGFVVFGHLSSRLDTSMRRQPVSSAYLAALTPALASFQLYLLRGPLQTTAALCGLTILVSWLTFPRLRRRGAAALPSPTSS